MGMNLLPLLVINESVVATDLLYLPVCGTKPRPLLNVEEDPVVATTDVLTGAETFFEPVVTTTGVLAGAVTDSFTKTVFVPEHSPLKPSPVTLPENLLEDKI